MAVDPLPAGLPGGKGHRLGLTWLCHPRDDTAARPVPGSIGLATWVALTGTGTPQRPSEPRPHPGVAPTGRLWARAFPGKSTRREEDSPKLGTRTPRSSRPPMTLKLAA